MDEASCLITLRQGGRPALAAISWLYRQFAARIRSYFLKHRLSEEQAQDCTQDVFVNLMRGCESFRGEVPISVWIWTIARNRLMDHYRRQTKTVSLDDDESPMMLDTEEGLAVEGGFSDGLQDCVHAAFEAFSREHPERAHVLYLVAWEEQAIESIAHFLGRTLGATREYISQCRKRLRPYLERCRDYLSPA